MIIFLLVTFKVVLMKYYCAIKLKFNMSEYNEDLQIATVTFRNPFTIQNATFNEQILFLLTCYKLDKRIYV